MSNKEDIESKNIDWTVGKYTKILQEKAVSDAKELRKQHDIEWLQKIKETLT